MQISDTGRKLIESCEGCKLSAYRDVAGVWTIGYGHTGAAGPPSVTAGLTVTAAQADQILSVDLCRFGAAVFEALKVPATQGQFDAMTSLAYNIGLAAFKSSTLLRNFNRGDTVAAAEAFLAWDYAGGVKSDGLVIRRNRERAMFLGVPYASMTHPVVQPMAHAVDHPQNIVAQIANRLELLFR